MSDENDETNDELLDIVGARADVLAREIVSGKPSSGDSQRMCEELGCLSTWMVARLVATVKLELEGSPLFKQGQVEH